MLCLCFTVHRRRMRLRRTTDRSTVTARRSTASERGRRCQMRSRSRDFYLVSSRSSSLVLAIHRWYTCCHPKRHWSIHCCKLKLSSFNCSFIVGWSKGLIGLLLTYLLHNFFSDSLSITIFHTLIHCVILFTYYSVSRNLMLYILCSKCSYWILHRKLTCSKQGVSCCESCHYVFPPVRQGPEPVAGEVPYGGGETDRPAAHEEVHSLPVLRGGNYLTGLNIRDYSVFIGLQRLNFYYFLPFFL